MEQQGPGRVGEAVRGSDGVVRSHKREHMESGSKRVFGAVRVARTGYRQRGVGSLFPRDAQLHLPLQSYSHRLPKRVAAQAAKMSFERVADDMAAATGVGLGTRQIEEIVYAAARDFDALYAPPCPEEIEHHAAAKPIQGLPFDGKGVVRRKEALREATRKRAEARAPQVPRGFARQDQSNRTRMATVAGISHIARHVRSPQSVAQQFAPLRLGPQHRPVAPKPVGKKRWASRAKPMQTVSNTGCAAGKRRDPESQAAWVV